MDTIFTFLKRPAARKLLVFTILGILIYLLKPMATLLLLTFIFIYIFNSLQKIISRFLKKFFPVREIFITVALYLLFLGLLALFISTYVPVIISQTSMMVSSITDYIGNLKKQKQPTDIYSSTLIYLSNNVDFSSYLESGSKHLLTILSGIGTTGMYLLVSLILSLFFIIDKKQIYPFIRRIRLSKIYWMYDDASYFFRKFTNSFGKVIQNQILISFINAMLSLIILAILHFPFLFGLDAMIFILGLVPVAGVFISLVPLSIIAFYTGGIRSVLYILILIAVLHTLESYILNPKLMSHSARIPVFFTLFILLISEHFMGIWGLIIGLPLAMFVLDVLDILPEN